MITRDTRDPKKFIPSSDTQPQESNSFQTQKEVVSPEQEKIELQRNERLGPEQKEKEAPTQETTEDVESTIEMLKRKLKGNKKKKIIIPTVKDELTIRVEKIMEEGLADAYKEMTTIQQQEFKIKGEETAWKIRELFKKTHIKIKEIFKLLVEWLRLLPGVNKFFIEQEAKIKADKILAVKKHRTLE